MTRPLSRQVLLDPRCAGLVRDRGIDWYVSRFAMVRADLIKPYEPSNVLRVRPWTVRGLLDSERAYGMTVCHVGTCTSDAGDVRAMLRADPDPYFLLVNQKAWAAWARRDWWRVSVDGHAVRFHELRRGRPVLCGLLMPVMPYGPVTVERLVDAA